MGLGTLKLMFIIRLMVQVRGNLVAEKKIYTENYRSENEYYSEDETTEYKNIYLIKCYECEDCDSVAHIDKTTDYCETTGGCFRYQSSYERTPEQMNKMMVVLEENLGCVDQKVKDECNKPQTNRTGPCEFCYSEFCNLPGKIGEREEPEERMVSDREERAAPAYDSIKILNRKPGGDSGAQTLSAKLFYLIVLFLKL